ncbi:hypothetical protein SUGI_0472250 [Cryptomeria japonica]|nr:hypothetical protein SUGI_0472250 [Cryptomeria japonica]
MHSDTKYTTMSIMKNEKRGAPKKWTLIKAHGPTVGLPTEDDMGNSEVGHNALGAGRIFAQEGKARMTTSTTHSDCPIDSRGGTLPKNGRMYVRTANESPENGRMRREKP